MAKVNVNIEKMAESEIERSEQIADQRAGEQEGGFERKA